MSLLRHRQVVRALGLCVLVGALPWSAAAQYSPTRETGFQPDRHYVSPSDFETLDTFTGNIILTFTDLALPGNAGRELRLQRTYNSFTKSAYEPHWTFGLAGLPMRILEVPYPSPSPLPFGNTVEDHLAYSPSLVMSDGAVRRTFFTTTPDFDDDPTIHSTMRWVTTSDFWRYDREAHQVYTPDGLMLEFGDAGLGPLIRRLTSVTDIYGHVILTLAWGPGSLQITQALGTDPARVISIALNGESLPTSMTYAGREWTYSYQAADRMSQVVFPEEDVTWTFSYGASALESVTLPSGGEIHYTYRGVPFTTDPNAGTIDVLETRQVIDPRGNDGTWTYTFNGAGLATIEDPAGNTAEYTYLAGIGPDAHRSMTGAYSLWQRVYKSPSGSTLHEETLTYDVVLPVAIHSPSNWWGTWEVTNRTISRNGQTYATTYGYADFWYYLADYHRPVTITETGDGGIQRTTTFGYAHLSMGNWSIIGRPVIQRVTVGSEMWTRSWTYDAATGFKTQETDFAQSNVAVGIDTNFTADAYGNVASVAKGESSTALTQFTYNYGRVANTMTRLHATTRVINHDGTVGSETQGGRTTFYQYDDLGRIVQVASPGTTPVVTTYDDEGAWVQQTQGSSVTTTTLDGFGRPIGTQSSLGVRTQTEYTAEGLVWKQWQPFIGTAGTPTITEYDGLGRVTRIVNPDLTETSRTYGAGTVTLRDENNHETVQTWQAFGDPDEARLVQLIDADQQQWDYAYNTIGLLTSVEAPDGALREWRYESWDPLVTREIHPESGTTIYDYDYSGRLETKTDARGTVFTYAYDANDRVSQITARNRVTAFGYEPGTDNRQWVSLASSDGINTIGASDTMFLYDAAGRLATKVDFIDGKTFTTGFEYDAKGNLVTTQYPTLGGESRRHVGYDVDAENRLTRVFDRLVTRDFASQFTYHPSGGITGYRAGNNVVTAITYDAARPWVRSITAGPMQLQYTQYDPAGNLLTLTDSRVPTPQTFGYDALDRLTSASGPYGVIPYAYDVHGNRVTGTGSVTYTYEPGTLRLASQGVATFTYDANGNLKTSPNRQFEYTPENWLEAAVVDGQVTIYQYDAEGWRIKKTTGSAVTYYFRGLNGELLTEWTNPGPSGAVRDYVYAGGRLISAISNTTTLATGDLLTPTTVGGPAVSVSVATPGQNARVVFNAVAGQTVMLNFTSATTFSCNWAFTLLDPNGSTVGGPVAPCAGTNQQMGPYTLAITGTYTVLVDPSPSTTGTVTVAVANVAASAPSITGISPTIGAAGTSVTVSGTNLQPLQALAFNVSHASGATGSSSSLSVAVPAVATSGPISVVTAGGTAVSTVDFFVPPAPYTPGEVATAVRAPIAVPTLANVPLANQVALLAFSRRAGERFTLRISSNGIYQQHLKVYQPDGAVLFTSEAIYNVAGDVWIEMPVAPVTGTYTLLIDPYQSYTGSATYTIDDLPTDVGGTIVANGVGVSFTITRPGQNAVLTFAGQAGQRVALAATNTTIGLTRVEGQAPDGSAIFDSILTNNSNFEPVYLPLDGVYRILVNPAAEYVGDMTLTLYTVAPDLTPTLTLDGTPQEIAISMWQKAFATFAGVPGQKVSLQLENVSFPSSCSMFGWLFDPNAVSLHGVFCATQFLDPVTMVAGSYTLKLDPDWTSTGTVRVKAWAFAGDVTDSVTLGGSTPFSTSVPGQNALITFSGTQGQRVIVNVSDGTFGSCQLYVHLRDPNNQQVPGTFTCMGASGSIGPVTLPSTGTYTIVLDPQGAVMGSALVALVDASPSIGLLTPDNGVVGQAVTIQGANFGSSQGTSTVTFNGTAASVTSWSATSIGTTVPSGATTGPVVVTVGGFASNDATFTINAAPSITSLSATAALVGSSITITGTNFGATQGTSTVTFNGTAAAVTNWSATSIAATVPAAATSGPVVVTVGGLASNGSAFTVLADTTYHLHKDASNVSGVLQLLTAGPNAASTSFQSATLGGQPPGEYLIKAFITNTGVPGVAGTLPAESTLTFRVHMRKTANSGVLYPRVRARLNSASGALLCTATGSTALTSTVQEYLLSCATESAVTVTSSDRIYLWVGTQISTQGSGSLKGEVRVEGTLNGNHDSRVIIPWPR